MPTTLRRHAVAALLAATLALGTAACSSASSSSSSGTTTTTPPGPTSGADLSKVTKVATVAAELPAATLQKGTLTVALDATYAPDEFVASDGKTVIGMDADLATAIGKVLGLRVTLTNATFDTIIPALGSGRFDMGASSLTDTLAREAQVDFVQYFQAGEGFYVKSGSSLTLDGLGSLCGHSVAVETGTTEETDAQTQAKTCTTAGKTTVKVLSYQSQNDANLAVSSGRADVGFLDSQVAGYVVAQSNGQFATVGQAFSVAPYGLALPKGGGLATPVLDALKSLMADGTYTAILQHWGVQAGAITTPHINGAAS